MKMNKKGDGLSLTTVVIAAIALVVLIILILIFSGRIAIFRKGVMECPADTSKVTTGTCASNNYDPIPSKVGEENSKIIYCCKAATVRDDTTTGGGSPTCVNGATQACTKADGTSGSQTCSSGTWGTCA